MADKVRVRLAVRDPEGVAARPCVVNLPVHLGRDPARAEIEIADRMVSRRHARLEADGDAIVIVDLDSGNGTWIGDEQVTRRVLAPGDEITVGTSTVAWTAIPRPPVPRAKPFPPAIRRSAPAASDPAAPPTFGTAWGVVLHEGRLRAIPLRGLYAAWVHAAKRVAELGDLLAVEDAAPAARLDAHDALNAATDRLLDGTLSRLGSLTFAFCATDRPLDAFASRVPRMRRLADHTRARDGVAALRGRLHTADADPTSQLVAVEDRRLVERVVAALRGGVAAFQQHGAAVVEEAGTELEAALKAVFVAFVERDQHVAAHLRVATAPGGSS
ncbi:FHA domain-containing protein [Actinomycetospora aeridis]|uniref:FHA domain-containing protein n=1 Tax=Actinomycetospora aeridis TaxID=3129231 RepID=A0ABU8ND85_9PSEU